MLKSIEPIWGRLRHLPRPQLFTTKGASGGSDGVSAGLLLAERVACAVGSWAFIGAQAAIMALWVLINTLAFTGALHFDEYPFVFLNLAMSAEAAFTGPVLLIAANFGAIRDHQQADRIERLGSQNEQLTEQNERLVQQLVNMEHLLERHVTQSLKAHSEQLADLNTLLREVHTSVCAQPVSAEAVAEPLTPSPSPARSRPRGRGEPGGGAAG